MGFFSSLWNGIKATAAAVVSVPLIAPFYIADKLGIIDLDGKKDKQTAQKIEQARKEVSKTTSLSKATTVQQIEDISKVLRNYRSFYENNAKTVEKILKDDIDECFTDLIRRLHEKENIAKSFEFGKIQDIKNQICGDIEGTIADAIRLKLSIDNHECRQILDIKTGSERDRKMRQFTEKIIKDSKEDLADKIGWSMNQMTNNIARALQSMVKKQEDKARSDQQNFDNWIQQMENKTFDSEKAQLEPRVKIYAIEQVEKIFAA